MKERLSSASYGAWKKSVTEGTPLDLSTANEIAEAMKQWAIEKGATHYTHWFQPMTGVTAEKHDSFISPINKGRDVIMEFSGKELIKGEPDASSFPSGGLRATFEARGYTAWDPTSYAFIKDDTLCIPTAFCSYGGEALDKKTPLLRSMENVTRQASRVLKLLGTEAQVVSTMGPEQEYFLVDKALYEKRKDLVITGRTLFGARPPKGQELEDHYFGSIKPRVKAFMAELNAELWKLGVLAKTEHNEAAPAQHELAPIYTTTNIATDHNQLTMEMMKKVAARHDLVCLLHEKPFAGVNGSGKHNNWSLSIRDGANLLDPGETPQDNARFLLFLCAVIAAVDDYQDLLRVSVSSAGNDHRLGAAEAPPAIMSMYLGEELTGILDSIENDTIYDAHRKAVMEIGANVLPKFPKDSTDRNRTSPFAFTGNKFEFRSCGSSMSISGPNLTLNTIVAEELSAIADRLEAELAAGTDVNKAVGALIKQLYTEHKRIIFNGNNYSEEWIAEAERRGLLNLRTTPDALPYFVAQKNIDLYEKHRIFTETEMRSRHEIHMESYCKVTSIEALTMLDMAKKEILPAVMRYKRELAESAAAAKAMELPCEAETSLAREIAAESDKLYGAIRVLDAAIAKSRAIEVTETQMYYIRDELIPAMNAVRASADALELVVAEEYWPMPTYEELLFNI